MASRSFIKATATSTFNRNTCRLRSNLSVTVPRTNVLGARLALLQYNVGQVQGDGEVALRLRLNPGRTVSFQPDLPVRDRRLFLWLRTGNSAQGPLHYTLPSVELDVPPAARLATRDRLTEFRIVGGHVIFTPRTVDRLCVPQDRLLAPPAASELHVMDSRPVLDHAHC